MCAVSNVIEMFGFGVLSFGVNTTVFHMCIQCVIVPSQKSCVNFRSRSPYIQNNCAAAAYLINMSRI